MIGSFLTTWTHYHRCEGNRVTVQRSIPAFSRLIEANCVFRRLECQPLSNALPLHCTAFVQYTAFVQCTVSHPNHCLHWRRCHCVACLYCTDMYYSVQKYNITVQNSVHCNACWCKIMHWNKIKLCCRKVKSTGSTGHTPQIVQALHWPPSVVGCNQ